jgi:Domain of unknown function (DUF222)
VAGDRVPAGVLAGRVAERLAPGPDLAGWLSLVPAGELGDADLAATAGAWRRLASWAQARELAAVAQIASRTAARDPDIGAEADGRPVRVPASAAAEVALELSMSRYGAAGWADLAVDLGWRLAATGAALESGDIDVYRARLISEATARLPDDAARAVEQRVLPGAGGQTPGMLRAALRRAVLIADPRGAEQRRRESERQAKVMLYPDEDHTATLAAQRLPVIGAAAAMARIKAMARAWKASGAPGGIDLLSAKVYLGLLLGTLPLIPPAEGAPPDIPPGDDPGDPDGGPRGPRGPGDPGDGPGGRGQDPSGGNPGSRPPGASRDSDGMPGVGLPRGRRSDGGQGSGSDGGSPAGNGPGSGLPRGDRPDSGQGSGSDGDSPGPPCGSQPRGRPPDSGPGGDGPGGGPPRGRRSDGGQGSGSDGGSPAGNGPGGGMPRSSQPEGRPPESGPGDGAPGDGAPGDAVPSHEVPPPGDQDAPRDEDDYPCPGDNLGGNDRNEDDGGWQDCGPAPDWPALPVILPVLARPATGLGPVPGLLDVTVPWRVLAGASAGPGYLGRIGPIPASQARRLASCAARDPAAQWRIIITTPVGHAVAVTRIPRPRGQSRTPESGQHGTGMGLVGRVTLTIPEDTLTSPPPGNRNQTGPSSGPDPPGQILRLALHAAVRAAARARAAAAADAAAGGCAHTTATPSYRPPPRLRDHVTARDLTCRNPVCRQPAWRGELDHTIPWDQGLTCSCNLGGMCKADHLLKHHPDWKLQQTAPGLFIWTTPSGRIYTVTPDAHPL